MLLPLEINVNNEIAMYSEKNHYHIFFSEFENYMIYQIKLSGVWRMNKYP